MNPNHILVPFPLAEECRIFLTWLASDDSSLNDDQKREIAKFSARYSAKMLTHILARYGQGAMNNAVMMSDVMARQFTAELNDAVLREQGSMFDRLDEEIFGGGGE